MLLCFGRQKNPQSAGNASGPSWVAVIETGYLPLHLGQQGGMLIDWKTHLFKLEAVEYGSYSLSAKLMDSTLGFSWWISFTYGPASNHGKEEFWVELNDLGNSLEELDV